MAIESNPPDDIVVAESPQDKIAKLKLSTVHTAEDVWDMALTGVISKNSKRVYRTALTAFARYLLEQTNTPVPEAPIDIMKAASPFLVSLDFTIISAYRDHCRTQNLSPSTINIRLAALDALFKRMKRLGMTDDNPADPDLVSRMRVSRVSKTQGLEQGEAEALLGVCAKDKSVFGYRDLALISVLMHNGLRRSEPLQMKLENFTFIGDTPTYQIRVKGDKTLSIEIIPEVWNVVARWIDKSGIKNGHVFRRIRNTFGENVTIEEKGLTPTGVYDIIRRRVAEAGINKNIHPHSLRHTYATLALLAGVPIQEVQVSMGHASTDTTFRYYRAIQQVGKSPGRALKLTILKQDAE
jgi:integrase